MAGTGISRSRPGSNRETFSHGSHRAAKEISRKNWESRAKGHNSTTSLLEHYVTEVAIYYSTKLLIRLTLQTAFCRRYAWVRLGRKSGTIIVMKATELVEAVDILRKAGWKVEPPATRSTSGPKRRGRPPKNGRRKRGRPRKQDISA